MNSPETKLLLEIAVVNGASIRTAYKAVRKRWRIEARRQKELDDGVEPEVVLDSFLNQIELEQHPQSEPLKRVLTPAAKAAKHRRARDKKLRETLCWWIANGKTCPDGDRCNFKHVESDGGDQSNLKHMVSDEKDLGVSGTGVLSPGPDSWNNSWDRYDFRDNWTDVQKRDHYGDRWAHGWNKHSHDDNWTDAWSKREPGDEWRTSPPSTSPRTSPQRSSVPKNKCLHMCFFHVFCPVAFFWFQG